jgi:hypothetical protein
MASEPKKPIEQMLEALAKARRAQFGHDPKMPNPMRARLHEEIARAGAAEDDKVEPRASWLTRFWPRVTVAAALATLIVLVPAIWWNRSHPGGELGDVAVRDRLAGTASGTLAKPLGVSASEPSVNLADNSQIKVQPGATPSSEAEALKSVTKGFTDKEIAAAKIQGAPAAAPADGADSKAKSNTMAAVAPPAEQPSSAGSLGTKQQFSQQSAFQSFRSNAQINQAANVLNTFQVQQQGNEIRVVDADGSTYTGKIQQLPKGAEPDSRIPSRHLVSKQTGTDAAQAAGETESAAPQSYFRATGYNVSLKKKLVFEGNYAAPPAQLPAKATSNDRQRAESSRNQARIVGTVRVNGEAPVEVDAIAETAEPAATKKSEK